LLVETRYFASNKLKSKFSSYKLFELTSFKICLWFVAQWSAPKELEGFWNFCAAYI